MRLARVLAGALAAGGCASPRAASDAPPTEAARVDCAASVTHASRLILDREYGAAIDLLDEVLGAICLPEERRQAIELLGTACARIGDVEPRQCHEERLQEPTPSGEPSYRPVGD